MVLLILLFGVNLHASDDIDVSIEGDKIYIELEGKEVTYPLSKEDLEAPEQLIKDILEDLGHAH